jgi:predicted MFS family arabinose efflux permease
MASKTKFRWAAVYITLFAAVTSVLFIYDNFHLRRLDPFEDIVLKNILLAKTDAAGDAYIIDDAMSRIVKMGAGGVADCEILGGHSSSIFYNAYDVAVEDRHSLFVHDVIWDASGMDVASERILEFDKRSGGLIRELYRLDRNDSKSNPELSGLIALRALKFGDGKLWFVRKSEDFFTLYSLVPGEEPVVEYAVDYDDALWTLGDFAVDIAGGRVFFADKAGVIKVFDSDKTETTTVFEPVSGVSVREFSLPYRLSFDGTELYFSDIGKRAVMRLEGENRAEIVFREEPDTRNNYPPFHHFVHSLGGLLTLTDNDSIVKAAPDGREILRFASLAPGRRIVSPRIRFWVSSLVLLSSLSLVATIAFKFANNGKANMKEGLSAAIIASAILTFIVLAPTIRDGVKFVIENEIMNRLSYVMEMSSKILDAEAFAEIKTPQDYNGPAYRKFMNSLNNLVSRDNKWNERIYCDVSKFGDGIQYSVCYLDGTIGAFANPRDIDDSNARAIAEKGEWIKNMNYQDTSGNYIFLKGPIYNIDGGIEGGIEIGVELRSLDDSVFALSKNLIVRSLLMLALVLFLVSEGLEYIMSSKIRSESVYDGDFPSWYYRAVTFLVFMAFNLPTAFLPNYALKMGDSFMGFSPNISAVLPITIGDAMLTAAPLISPFLIARLGLRLSFFLGFVLCASGYAISAAAATIAPLIAGMSVLGLGAGILFTLLQTHIASRRDAGERALDFSSFASSSFAGMNCGIMIGGIIATSFSQKAVFSFGFFLLIFVMTAFLILTRKKTGKQEAEMPAGTGLTGSAPVRPASAFPLGIPAFLFLSFFPFTLCSGFISYLVPVFGDQSGLSDSEISLILIFFGVGITFLGSKIVTAARGDTTQISCFLWLSLVMEVCGIFCFASYQSVGAMLVAVFILGGAYGIGNVYFPLYLTEMSEVKTLREGSAMAFFNFTENLGSAAGPMIFSIIFNSEGSLGYYVLAAMMFLSSLLYGVVRRNRAAAYP